MSSALAHIEARAALRTRLATCPSILPEAQRAYEGFTFTPKVGTPFIEDKVVGTGDIAVSNGAIEHKISYILTLKYPPNEGTAAIETMAGLLLDHYKVGTKLSSGGTTWLSYGAERRGGIAQETDWQVLTVVVDLQTFTIE